MFEDIPPRYMYTPIEQILADLVAFHTVSDDIPANDTALDYIEHFLALRGMHCKRFRFDGHGAFMASSRPDNMKASTVVLAAHVDVMTASDRMFTLRIEDDKLIGRGVYDMKFAIAGYMQFVDEIQHNLADYDFSIMIVADEELGGRDNISGTRQLTELGYGGRVCILPDSTAPGWDIERLCKGHWRFELTASGKTAHSSRPWLGDSASFKIVEALHEIRKLFPAQQEPLENTLNFGLIEGGITFNQIPSSMKALVEVRIISEERYQEQRAQILAICERYGITSTDRAFTPVITTDLNDPLVNAFTASIANITNRQPEGYVSLAASDTPYFDAIGVPCILSCPSGGMHHSEEEWLSRDSLAQFVPILRNYMDTVAYLPLASVDKTASLVVN